MRGGGGGGGYEMNVPELFDTFFLEVMFIHKVLFSQILAKSRLRWEQPSHGLPEGCGTAMLCSQIRACALEVGAIHFGMEQWVKLCKELFSKKKEECPPPPFSPNTPHHHYHQQRHDASISFGFDKKKPQI